MSSSPFADLDRDAQVARLDALAARALAFYDLQGASCRLISYTNNAIYRVDAGQTACALRIHRPGLKPLDWIESELDWLRALNHETALPVPHPLEGVYTGALDGYAGPVYVDRFAWMQGDPLPAESLTPEQVGQIGAFAARLHQFTATYQPPPGFVRPRLDWEGLFGDDSPYDPGPAGEALFTAEQRAVIAAVTGRVRETMDALDAEGGFRLIHADLIPKNLLWRGGMLQALDFDDCAYGYTLYDLAPALLFFKPQADYPARFSALWAGYTALQPLPDAHRAHLEALIAGRYVASIRWVAGNTMNPAIKGRAEAIIAARTADLNRYLQQGELDLAHYPR